MKWGDYTLDNQSSSFCSQQSKWITIHIFRESFFKITPHLGPKINTHVFYKKLKIGLSPSVCLTLFRGLQVSHHFLILAISGYFRVKFEENMPFDLGVSYKPVSYKNIVYPLFKRSVLFLTKMRRRKKGLDIRSRMWNFQHNDSMGGPFIEVELEINCTVFYKKHFICDQNGKKCSLYSAARGSQQLNENDPEYSS